MIARFALLLLLFSSRLALANSGVNGQAVTTILQSLHADVMHAVVWQGDQTKAHTTDQLIEVSQKEHNLAYLAHGYYVKGHLYQLAHIYDSSVYYTNKAKTIEKKMEKMADRREFLLLQGIFFAKLQGQDNLNTALNYFNLVIDLSTQLKDYDKIVTTKNKKAWVKMVEGDYFNAMKIYKSNLDLLPHCTSKSTASEVFINIGHIYNAMGLYNKGLRVHQATLKQDLENDLQDYVYVHLINISESYEGLKLYDSALYYLSESKQHLECTTNTYEAAISHFNKGKIFYKDGRFSAALEQLKQCKKSLEPKYYHEYLKTLVLISKIQLELNQHQAAQSIAREIVQLNTKRRYTKTALLDLYEGFRFAHALLGDTTKAYHYQSQFIQLYQALFNNQNSSRIIESELNTQLKYNQILSQLQVTRTEADLKTSKFNTIISLFLTFLLAIIVTFFIYRYVVKKQHNRQLKLEIKNRTSELKRKNKILEEYSFINAHKLRAPVARILGLCNLVRLSEDNIETYHLIDKMESETSDLDNIVKSITSMLEKQ